MPRRYLPREVLRVLEYLGWRIVRTRGSHARLKREDGSRPVTLALYRRELPPKTLNSILKQSGLSLNEFSEAAEEVL